MKILVLCIADGEYLKGAKIVQDSFKKNITNPEGHNITYRVDPPNDVFDYLHFWNDDHKGRRISLSRFQYFTESEFDRIIYLDSDMLVVGNVDLLISNELNSKDYWACHVHGYENYYKERMKEREITNNMIINGGLQIWNSRLLSISFENNLMTELRPGMSFDGSDQGYITELFPSLGVKMGWLEDKYNYCLQDPYRPQIDDIRINHYTGRKLWEIQDG